MTDVNLLVFGCVVSFIAVAGAYVYFRECLTADERPRTGRGVMAVVSRVCTTTLGGARSR
jgi:hypothetical protein